MNASPNTRSGEVKQVDRQKVTHLQRMSLGYLPMRMKPVHFATSFLLALCRRYRRLEWLNKTANPKATERAPEDEYVAENLFPLLQDDSEEILSSKLKMEEFKLLRQHLNAAFNNDGAALGAAFTPYSTFGCDYSMPSMEFLSNQSKNHGNAGAFAWLVLDVSRPGKDFLSLARKIADNATSPAAMFGRPLIDDSTEEYAQDLSDLCGSPPLGFLKSSSDLMRHQTEALRKLAGNLQHHPTAFALRHLVLGLGSWLLVYQIRRIVNCDQTIFFCDFTGETRSRLRAQSAACYSRQLGLFGRSLHLWMESNPSGVSTEDYEAFSKLGVKASKDLEDHFRDFSVRIGWVQPRTGTPFKYFRPQPDTMRVLLMSVLEPNEVCTMDELAERLRRHWNLVLGLLPKDHATLLQHGYTPLDEDSDLQANREAFKQLAVHLGLAWEPSDGLVLFSLNPDHLL
ncbi:MAG: hypothetical protein HQL52_13595 [Magnetococcales bacterium]|nr:hypothetical protein [Magnetococcales bacterium]